MKYLYGDSVPCPVQFNFLAAFETFIDSATQTAKLDLEISKIQEKSDSAIAAREQALKVVEDFHQRVMDSMKKLAIEHNDTNTAAYSAKVQECAQAVVEEARKNCRLSREIQSKEQGSEFERRRKDLTTSIERILKTELMVVEGSILTMNLIEGRNQLTAVLNHPGAIVTTFTMSGGTSIWQSPVMVSTLVRGLELQAGVRKSWITGSRAKSAISLDDFFVGGFELQYNSAVIRLRKHPDQSDAFVFKFDRKGNKLNVLLDQTDEGDEQTTLDEDNRSQLERLWQMLAKAAGSALKQRGRLLGVQLDGKDLFTQKRALPFLQRVVEGIAPTVQNISKHSPNPAELSMKVEGDDGRREEIYVRRESLVRKIETLSAEGRAVFAPLGLLHEPLTSDDTDVVM